MAAAAAGFALAVAVVVGVEVAGLVVVLDEQAVATRPRPNVAVITTARCRRRPTVLPSLEGRALHGPLEFPLEPMRPARRSGVVLIAGAGLRAHVGAGNKATQRAAACPLPVTL